MWPTAEQSERVLFLLKNNKELGVKRIKAETLVRCGMLPCAQFVLSQELRSKPKVSLLFQNILG